MRHLPGGVRRVQISGTVLNSSPGLDMNPKAALT
jgi:hypothetical protein